ncbi:hypothetical protein Tco_1186230 [Tanacetum coccineum]
MLDRGRASSVSVGDMSCSKCRLERCGLLWDEREDTFQCRTLRSGLDDSTMQVPLDEIRVDAKLNFMEEPVEILEREFKKLKCSRIAIVNV